MKSLHVLAAASLVAIVSVSAVTAQASAKRDESRHRLTEKERLDAILRVQSLNQKLSLFGGPTVDCTVGVQCDVPIEVQELFDTGGALAACAIQVGTVNIKLVGHPSPRKTVIHWTIQPLKQPHVPPTNATYTFAGGFGLIVLKDGATVTAKKPDTVSATDMTMTVGYKAATQVIYYPVVFQTIGTNDPSLCGSADPKIVNV